MKHPRLHILCSLMIMLFIISGAVAQPVVKATVDKNTIRIGDPLQLKLTATWPGKATSLSSFEIPDSIPHFDIWENRPPLIIKDGIEQSITLTSYDSGRFAIPSFPLNTTDSNGNIHTDSILVSIIPVNVDTLKDYHDIKDIIGIPPIEQWPYVAGIAAITLISLVRLYYFLKKIKTAEPKAPVFVPKGNPYTTASKSLEKLQQDTQAHMAGQPGATLNSKTFFTRLTNIYRTYLLEAYNFKSYHQTGDELILQAKSLLEQEVFFQFGNTIRLSDAAKFAKYEPPFEEWQQSIKTIRKTIGLLDEKLIGGVVVR